MGCTPLCAGRHASVGDAMNRIYRLVASFCLCSALAGCAEHQGPKQFPLSGKVSVDGTPMELGSISFIPKSDTQRVSGGTVLDGTYTVDVGRGANAGLYRVEIRWQKPTGKKYRDRDSGEMMDVRKEGLPKRYHAESVLTADVSEEQTVFDFDLQSK